MDPISSGAARDVPDDYDAFRRVSRRKTILYVVNVDWFFLSHRLAVARGAARAGFDVHVTCAPTGKEELIRAEGFTFHPLDLARGRSGPVSTLRSTIAMYRIIRGVRPDIVHLVTIKPVLLGGAAARLARVPKVVAAISGLGYIFIAQGALARIKRGIVGLLYRFALKHRRVRIIFQNTDDAATIARLAGISDAQARLIRGSGVDLARFEPRPMPSSPPTVVVLAARLLIDKGVREFIEAARILAARGVSVRCLIAGSPDPDNPACMPADELAKAAADGVVELLGPVSDMPALFAGVHIVALPSYREGMPLVLLEAAAAGRAVVTTDVPGCRTAIEDGTGLLVPAKDASALADAIGALARDPARCIEMGRNGRRLAETAFSIDDVISRHIAIYDEPV